MEAGESAEEQARLAAERVARLKRQLDHAERATTAWAVGAAGEKAVEDSLCRLIPKGWHLMHNVHWPGRPEANLDYVLVGPGGVVVVDAKNWTGEVRVSSGVLWQGRYARTQSVEGALAQCAAVVSIMAPPHRRHVRPLICMSRQPDLFGITSSDVAVAGTDRVVDAIMALPAVLDQQTVVALYAQLGRQLARKQPDRSTGAQQPGSWRAGAPQPGAQQPGTTRKSGSPAEADAFVDQPRRRAEGGRPEPRGPIRGRRAGRGAAHHRKSTSAAHDHGAGGLARLLFLAACVTFAVYVLPYWGR